MAAPVTVAFPPNLVLKDGAQIQLDAVDAASGATVAGVNVANVTLQVELIKGDAGLLAFGEWLMVTGPGG